MFAALLFHCGIMCLFEYGQYFNPFFTLCIGPGLRSMDSAQNTYQLLSGTIDDLDGYGCWCYFDEDVGRGQGTPVNKIDARCRNLHHGYACARLDDSSNNVCQRPWEVSYTHVDLNNYLNTLTLSYEDVHIECETKNAGDDCKSRACAVESYFILNLVTLALTPNTFDYSFSHAENVWDPTANCLPMDLDSSEKECCGDYPLRFPFKTKNGERGCCKDVTYDTNMHNCCAGDVLSLAIC